MGLTGSVLIHHFGKITQTAIVSTEHRTYAEANLRHFTSKWHRTVRGNWLQRRWTEIRDAATESFERARYGHTLIERPPREKRIKTPRR